MNITVRNKTSTSPGNIQLQLGLKELRLYVKMLEYNSKEEVAKIIGEDILRYLERQGYATSESLVY